MVFPYGNDLNNLDSWAGSPRAKSENYMVAYHSGVSLILGAHTFLFFGKESLCAFSATLIGGGPSVSYGLSKVAKRMSRKGGQSNRHSSEYDISKSLERIEKGKEVNGVRTWSQSLDDVNSAEKIYTLITNNISAFKALIPFSANDLDGTIGVVSGVKADFLVGGAGYYIADANNLFTKVIAFNLTTEPTLLSASLGTLGGVWRVGNVYDFWAEIKYAKKEKYPFQGYDVHTFFKQWNSREFSYEQETRRYDQQDRIINQITKDMIKNPSKYGYPDSDYALRRAVERTEQFYNSKRSLESNSFLPWIPADERELFDAPKYSRNK